MPRLLNLLSTYHEYLRRFRAVSFSKSPRKAQALKEHGQILQAVIDRDEDRAEHLVKMHLANAIEALVKEMDHDDFQERKRSRNLSEIFSGRK
jgi:DNA-binding GntR family transcriptional regulator